MSYYEKHVFFCTNRREAGAVCCAGHDAQALRDYAKDRIKALARDGQGKMRINSAGCMGRCEEGPVLVVYPEAVWYTYVDRSDIDDIVEQHLCRGQVVERLRI